MKDKKSKFQATYFTNHMYCLSAITFVSFLETQYKEMPKAMGVAVYNCVCCATIALKG